MFSNIRKTLTAAALFAAVAVPAVGSQCYADSSNRATVKTAFNKLNLNYDTIEGKIVIQKDGYLFIVNMNEDKEQFSVVGIWRCAIPESKRQAMYEVINELNTKYNLQYWLDSDGDLLVQIAFDTDDMSLSTKVVATTYQRVHLGLEQGKKLIEAAL